MNNILTFDKNRKKKEVIDPTLQFVRNLVKCETHKFRDVEYEPGCVNVSSSRLCATDTMEFIFNKDDSRKIGVVLSHRDYMFYNVVDYTVGDRILQISFGLDNVIDVTYSEIVDEDKSEGIRDFKILYSEKLIQIDDLNNIREEHKIFVKEAIKELYKAD